MAKYHINPETGTPGICTATVRGCKFAIDGEMPKHYNNEQEAQKAYEITNSKNTVQTLSQNKPAGLKKMTKAEIKELDNKISDLSGGSYSFEQNEWKTGPEKGTPLHDELFFSDESDLGYVIIEQDGEFLIKTDYGMMSNDLSKFKPITTEFEPDMLIYNVPEFFEGKYTMWEDEATEEIPYEDDFVQQQFGELSKLLKNRYGVK